jgi:hypothetical protein
MGFRVSGKQLLNQCHNKVLVILLALDTKELYESESIIQAKSPNSFTVPCDLSKPSDIQEFVKTIRIIFIP